MEFIIEEIIQQKVHRVWTVKCLTFAIKTLLLYSLYSTDQFRKGKNITMSPGDLNHLELIWFTLNKDIVAFFWETTDMVNSKSIKLYSTRDPPESAAKQISIQ